MRIPLLIDGPQVMASLASFGSSTINIGLVAAWKGHQQGWFCLLACSLDVLINALAIYWVTKPGEWSTNAEGIDTSQLLVTTRKSMDPRQEKIEDPGRASRVRQSTSVAYDLNHHSRAIEDKDAYLRPQPNVYYPLGLGLGSYEDDPASHTLAYSPAQGLLQPPMIPEPILLSSPRTESDLPPIHQSSSYEPATSIPPRTASGSQDYEIGFMDFLGETAVRLPRGPVECRRNSQEEEEGRFQKAFFNVLLGRSKSPSSGVCGLLHCAASPGADCLAFGCVASLGLVGCPKMHHLRYSASRRFN